MSFPVRCYVVHRGPLGDDLQKTLKDTGRDLTAGIIKAVVKQAAFSVGIQIGLMFVPIIGQAIAGLMSVTQMIVGKYYQKQVSDLIADTMDEIKKRGDAVQERVQKAGEQVYMEELPAGRALAMSDQPLDEGLGSNIFEKAGSAINKTASNVVKVIKSPQKSMKLIVDVCSFGLRPLSKAVMNIPVYAAKRLEIAQVVKAGTLTKPLIAARETVNDVAFSAEKLVSPITMVQESVGLAAKHTGQVVATIMRETGNEKGAAEVTRISEGIHTGAQEMMTAATPAGAFNLFTGRETLVEARLACERMRTQAFAQLDKMAIDGIAKIQAPEGRKAMRIGIAKNLRNDPVFQAQMQELREIEAAERAALDTQSAELTAIVGPGTKKTSGAGTLIGVGAAVAAAFAFTR